jgi:hypothetical protein
MTQKQHSRLLRRLAREYAAAIRAEENAATEPRAWRLAAASGRALHRLRMVEAGLPLPVAALPRTPRNRARQGMLALAEIGRVFARAFARAAALVRARAAAALARTARKVAATVRATLRTVVRTVVRAALAARPAARPTPAPTFPACPACRAARRLYAALVALATGPPRASLTSDPTPTIHPTLKIPHPEGHTPWPPTTPLTASA